MIVKYRKSVYRLTNILKLLIENEKNVAVSVIASINNCSERTVYNDINLLVKRWNRLLKLDISHTNLLSFNASIGNIQNVHEQILALDPYTVLIRTVVETPRQSLEFYAEIIGYSEQATRKIIHSLNDSLRNYHVKLSFKCGRLFLGGDEFTVRYFLACFYYMFQRCFELPANKVVVRYNQQSMQYSESYGIVSAFYRYLRDISICRYSKGFYMDHTLFPHNIDTDVNKAINVFVQKLDDVHEEIRAIEEPLYKVLWTLGYAADENVRKRFMVGVCSILYMERTIHSVNRVENIALRFFMNHYVKVNQRRYLEIEKTLRSLFEPFTKEPAAVVNGIIYTINLMAKMRRDTKRIGFMVFSDLSIEHGHMLKQSLEELFPHNDYYVYFGAMTLRMPSEKGVHRFCAENQCSAIISTVTFPYKMKYPLMTISDYLVGFDVGDIFDFINAVK